LLVTVVTGELTAVVSDLEKSVAVKVQLVPEATVGSLALAVLKVATPLTAVALSGVVDKVHEEVR
jgi:hypothetical protein